MSRPEIRQWRPEPDPETPPPDLAAWLSQVARGDHQAFELVYAELAAPVYGVVRQVLRCAKPWSAPPAWRPCRPGGSTRSGC